MQDLSLYFRALSDRKRLRIAEYLARHEQVTVSQLGAELRMSQPLMSWHLRMLRRAGIVKTRRAGRQVLCSLNRKALISYQRRVNEALGLTETDDGDGEEAPLPLKSARRA
jgi:DNA-binding transcriptional ArsR family regulator